MTRRDKAITMTDHRTIATHQVQIAGCETFGGIGIPDRGERAARHRSRMYCSGGVLDGMSCSNGQDESSCTYCACSDPTLLAGYRRNGSRVAGPQFGRPDVGRRGRRLQRVGCSRLARQRRRMRCARCSAVPEPSWSATSCNGRQHVHLPWRFARRPVLQRLPGARPGELCVFLAIAPEEPSVSTAGEVENAPVERQAIYASRPR